MVIVILSVVCFLHPWKQIKREDGEDWEGGGGGGWDTFYVIGPHSHFNILGIYIDTTGKYIFIIVYCFVNSTCRTLCNSILHSWLINCVQNENLNENENWNNKDKRSIKKYKRFAYKVTIVTTVYTWFDWFLYMNILLSQIDMFMVEIISDLFTSILTTHYYINKSKPLSSLENENNEIDLEIGNI
jgi:hypothetical protein